MGGAPYPTGVVDTFKNAEQLAPPHLPFLGGGAVAALASDPHISVRGLALTPAVRDRAEIEACAQDNIRRRKRGNGGMKRRRCKETRPAPHNGTKGRRRLPGMIDRTIARDQRGYRERLVRAPKRQSNIFRK